MPQDVALARLRVTRLAEERRTTTGESRREEFDQQQETAVLALAKLEAEDAQAANTAAAEHSTGAENGIIFIATFIFGVVMNLLASTTPTCTDAAGLAAHGIQDFVAAMHLFVLV